MTRDEWEAQAQQTAIARGVPPALVEKMIRDMADAAEAQFPEGVPWAEIAVVGGVLQ